MEWTNCNVVTNINGNEHIFAKISVCVIPRMGEKIRIKGKKITLPDGTVADEQEWVVTDIYHNLSYPNEAANKTNKQSIKIYVEAVAGRGDD